MFFITDGLGLICVRCVRACVCACVCVCVCVHVVDSGSVFKHILIYVRGADFCLLISHLDDHSIHFNQKKILSFTFPLLSLSFC